MKLKICILAFLLASVVSAQEKRDLNNPQTIENAKTLVGMLDKIDSTLAYMTPSDSANYDNILSALRNSNKKVLISYIQSDSIWFSVIRPHETYLTINDPLRIFKNAHSFTNEVFLFIHRNMGEEYLITQTYYSNIGNIYPGEGITIKVRLENQEQKKIDVTIHLKQEFTIYGIVFELFE